MKNRLRLVVFRSNKALYAQIIDDKKGETLVAANSLKLKNSKTKKLKKIEQAFKVGKLLAERAVKKGIKKVKFDRRGYKYHGRVKALAEGARKGGLEF
jgi:large subunit ribosomal protein L18